MDLEQCLRLLRANSDEEKFVGLYLITKFIKAEPGPTMRLIWESIGPSFLHRMLKTEGKVGGAEGFSYRGLALSILAAFSADDNLASNAQFIATVPSLVSLIHPRSHSEQEVVRDALQCLIAVSNTPEGARKVVESDGLAAVLLGVTEDEPPELLKARFHLSDKLVQLMRATHEAFPPPSAAAVLEHLASLFRLNQRALKFVVLERLPAILELSFERRLRRQQQQRDEPSNTQERAEMAKQHARWIEDVRVGLFYVLVSKIGRLQKEHALTLCAHVLRYFGESWAVGPVPPLDVGTGKTTGGEQNEGRFVEVMMLQTGVEVRLLLDSYMHPEIMTRDAALEAQQEVRAKAQGKGKAKAGGAPGVGTWEQEGKKGGPSATPLPREAMRYAPALPLPASADSVSYVTEELSDEEDEGEEGGQQSNDDATSSSSTSSTSAPAGPADPLVELLASPSDDLQARFEAMLSVYYEILEHAITFLAATPDGEMDEDGYDDDDDAIAARNRRRAATAASKKGKGADDEPRSWASLNFQALVNIRKMLSDVFETILDFVKDVQQEREQEAHKKKKEIGKGGAKAAEADVKGKGKADAEPAQGGSVRLTLEDLESMDIATPAADAPASVAETDLMDVVREGPSAPQPSGGQQVQATDLVVVATMRLLGLWISHDTETLKDSLLRVLPFMINLKTDRARVGVDPFSFLLPGLVPLTQEDDARDKFIDADGHIRLLAFMGEEVLAQRSNQSAQQENYGPLVSCLGILLNLVCLEEGLVNHRDPVTFVCYLPVLSDLARLVDFNSPPADTRDTEKALVLAHTLVAAFFILKFHTAASLAHHWAELGPELRRRAVPKTTAEAQSVSALLDLLVDDYFKLFVLCHGDESLWGEISELWFMATEALRSSLKAHPELGTKAKATPWLPKAMACAGKGGHAQAALRSVVEAI